MSDIGASHFKAVITVTVGTSERRKYELVPVGGLSFVQAPEITQSSSAHFAQRGAPIVLRTAPGKRPVGLPIAGELIAEGLDAPSILWASSLAIAPVSLAEGFITSLDLLRQLLLSAPSLTGLLLLGHGVTLPCYHTSASLAKLRIGVRESGQRDDSGLADEARDMLRRARMEEQDAVTSL